MGTYTTIRTPVLHAVLWDGNLETIKDFPDIEHLLADHLHYRDGMLTFSPGSHGSMTLIPGEDYLVRGVTGHYFVMGRVEFENTYLPIDVDAAPTQEDL